MASEPDAHSHGGDQTWPAATAFVSAIKDSYNRSMQTLRKKLGRRRSHSSTACSTRVSRALKHLQVLAVFSSGACVTMAASSLALAEVITMTLLYCFLVPDARHWDHFRQLLYRFSTSLEDIVLLSYARCVAVLMAYMLGSGPRMMRPYWYTAVAFAVAGTPFLITKAVFLFPTDAWLAPTALIAASLGFALAHLGSAINVMLWARRRHVIGLAGYDKLLPWEAGTDLHREDLQGAAEEATAIAPAELADADSLFMQLEGVCVHYKLYEPQAGRGTANTCIVLLHGFGGGVFVWRHIAGQLADLCGCPVLAFDRPGFGLTSRPGVVLGDANPYALDSSAALTVELCRALGFTRVLLAGHADGAMLAVITAARFQPGTRDASSFPAELPKSHRGDNAGLYGKGAEVANSERAGHGDVEQALPQEEEKAAAPEAGLAQPSVSGRGEETAGGSAPLEVLGVALLHPTAEDEGEVGPSFARLLGNSRLGRRMLARMLRSEIGEVYNRGAWGQASLVTPAVIDLYKTPLRTQGWDAAIIEVTRARKVGRRRMQECFQAVEHLPTLVLTGAKDRIVPLRAAAVVSNKLPASSCIMLPAVGHCSHEEAPDLLANTLSPFFISAQEARLAEDAVR